MTSLKAHWQAAQNAATEANNLVEKRDALETERKANETTMERLQTERNKALDERKLAEDLIQKRNEEFATLKAEREAHREPRSTPM